MIIKRPQIEQLVLDVAEAYTVSRPEQREEAIDEVVRENLLRWGLEVEPRHKPGSESWWHDKMKGLIEGIEAEEYVSTADVLVAVVGWVNETSRAQSGKKPRS